MMAARCCVFAAMLAGVFQPAAAQTQTPDRASLQAAGLFLNGCLSHVGAPEAMRQWMADHKVPAAEAGWAAPFLAGKSGRAFVVDTIGGRMVVVSFDSGSCALRILFADKPMIDVALATDVGKAGWTMAPGIHRISPSGHDEQTVFAVSFGSRHWTVSTTRKDHADAPASKPEVIILATGD